MDAAALPPGLPPGPKKLAYAAYLTLRGRLLPHRQLATEDAPLSLSAFFAALDQEGYVQVAAAPTAGGPTSTYFVIMSGGTTATNMKFREVLARVGPRRRAAAVRYVVRDVVLVVPELPLASHPRKLLATLQATDSGVHYLAFEYRVFATDLPAADSYDPHRILPADEVPRALGPRAPDLLPIIFENDPALAWVGGRPGDIVEIRHASDSCGVAVSFRRIVAL